MLPDFASRRADAHSVPRTIPKRVWGYKASCSPPLALLSNATGSVEIGVPRARPSQTSPQDSNWSAVSAATEEIRKRFPCPSRILCKSLHLAHSPIHCTPASLPRGCHMYKCHQSSSSKYTKGFIGDRSQKAGHEVNIKSTDFERAGPNRENSNCGDLSPPELRHGGFFRRRGKRPFSSANFGLKNAQEKREAPVAGSRLLKCRV